MHEAKKMKVKIGKVFMARLVLTGERLFRSGKKRTELFSRYNVLESKNVPEGGEFFLKIFWEVGLQCLKGPNDPVLVHAHNLVS